MNEQPQKHRIKFIHQGMIISAAIDLLPENKFKYLQNIRSNEIGIMKSRPKLGANITLKDSSDSIHSLKQINYESDFTLIAGAGDKVYSSNTNLLLERASGFDGKPLTLVDFRPEASVKSHCFIGNAAKMGKIDLDDLFSTFGIETPIDAPIVKVAKPLRKIIDHFEDDTIGSWTVSAGSKASTAKINTTIKKIIYDEVSNVGFCSIIPEDFDEFHEGVILKIDTEEDLIAEELFSNVIPINATIENITYTTGTTGECIITPNLSSPLLKKHSILKLAGSEYVKVLEVLPAINGLYSFKCITVGARAIGDTIEGFNGFRTFTATTLADTDTIVAKKLTYTIAASGINNLSRNITADLSSIANRTLTDDDFIFCAIRADTLEPLTEIQLMFDVDRVTNDFTQNYYYYAINPNFFLNSQNLSQSTLAVQQQVSQIQQLFPQQNYGLPAGVYPLEDPSYFETRQYLMNNGDYQVYEVPNVPQTALGDSQWSIFKIRLGDFIRVGSDISQSFRDLKAIRISVKTNAAMVISFDSLWLGGGYELSGVRDGLLDLNYVYRYENEDTKEVSGWSPPLRQGIKEKRNRLELYATPSTNPIVNKIAFARFGSSLNDWRILGRKANDSTPFLDEYSDTIIADNEKADFDIYQPFAIYDKPRKGKCDVNGIEVHRLSGDLFNNNWMRGSAIIINGIENKLYTNPTQDKGGLMQLEKSMGSLLNVDFYLPQAVIGGKPLPIIFGVYGEGSSGLFIFGLGDEINPGWIYWLNGNSCSVMSSQNFLEITSPSEPLLNGVIYDNKPFVWTAKRGFQLFFSPRENGSVSFRAEENAGTRGLFARYAITVCEHGIFYQSDDGIYSLLGSGNSNSITAGVLENFFPKDGKLPEAISFGNLIIYPPDYTDLDNFRLHYAANCIFWNFKNINNQYVCMIYSILLQQWISYDVYVEDIRCIYSKENIEGNFEILYGGTGRILNEDSTSTLENNIQAKVLHGLFSAGDMKLRKIFDEYVLDANANTEVNVDIYFNNFQETFSNETFESSNLITPTRELFLSDLADTNSNSVAAIISFTLENETELFEQQFGYYPYEELIEDSSTPFTDSGILKDKWYQGFVIEADTFGQDKVLKFQTDDGLIIDDIIINHSGLQVKSYSFQDTFIAHAVKQYSEDGVEWIRKNIEYKFDIEPEKAKRWKGQFSTNQIIGYKHIKKLFISHRSTSNLNIKIIDDNGNEELYTITQSDGEVKKDFIFLRPNKSLLYQFDITSLEDARLYKNHCEIYIKGFNSPEDYQIIQPFGDDSNQTEIRI